MPDEKRRFTRVKYRVRTEITAGGTKYTTDLIRDLSVGGCLVPVKAELEPGSECDIKILLSGESNELAVQIDGKVVRCDQETIAIKFIGIDPDNLQHLQNIIRYNSSDTESVEEEILRHPGLGLKQ